MRPAAHRLVAREASGRPLLVLDDCYNSNPASIVPNQELVLRAFEEEGWPPRIADPLPPRTDQDVKRRLHSTICNLNRAHEVVLIHFEGGGDGESICWRWLSILEARAERG